MGRSFSDGGGSGAAMACRDAAISLHFRGVGAVVGCKMIPGLHGAIPIPEVEAVSGDNGEECHQRSQGGAPMDAACGGGDD